MSRPQFSSSLDQAEYLSSNGLGRFVNEAAAAQRTGSVVMLMNMDAIPVDRPELLAVVVDYANRLELDVHILAAPVGPLISYRTKST